MFILVCEGQETLRRITDCRDMAKAVKMVLNSQYKQRDQKMLYLTSNNRQRFDLAN